MSVKVFSARVHNGAIVPQDQVELLEGSTLTIVADDGETTFATDPDDEAELLASIAEAERDEVISAADLLRRLSR